MAVVPLGPFELVRVIGAGGMGTVWEARHVAEGVAVAVKVVRTADARYARAFRREVRAVAALEHPGIVKVFDYGEIPPETAEAVPDLGAGSPFLAMELARDATLRHQLAEVSWEVVRSALSQVLRALAHAHARGVVHRDLKPANVLRFREGGRLVFRLADFGIAHALESAGAAEAEAALGTPSYMAPEQFLGLTRHLGPWTDLYALGCMAWELVTGRRPFSGSQTDLAAAHLREVPVWNPAHEAIGVPEGFDRWVLRLLAKEPRNRFRFAADALHALEALGEPPERPRREAGGPSDGAAASEDATTVWVGGATEPSPAPEFTRTPTTVHQPGAGFTPTTPGVPRPWEEAARDSGPGPDGGDGLARPPVPEHWRGSRGRPRAAMLSGVGLGLVGLRPIPMVDREVERDVLWGALRAVHEEGRACAVLVRGASGMGKSRLARWLCERAHEVGAASVVRATHGIALGPADGIEAMLARRLRATGLQGERLAARIDRELPALTPRERERLSELLMGRSGLARNHRLTLVWRALRGLSLERPVVVWLDDVQWGEDALGLAAWVLEAQEREPSPILLVLTAQEEALGERPEAAAALEALTERMQTVRLGPLEGEDRTALLQALLGLDGSLTAELAARTGGNPLFAEQLVEDWVQRGVLRPRFAGFVLEAGAEAPLPDSLHRVWGSRVERLLEGQPGRAAEALEVAATLGPRVRWSEWVEAAAGEGLQALAERLFEQRLAVATEDGWAFVHVMLRESLQRRAEEAGRAQAHERACAEMLEARPPEPGRAERLGLHWLAAGEAERARGPLLQGVEERVAAGALAAAERLLEAHRRARGATVDVAASLLEADLHSMRGRHDEGLAQVDRALAAVGEGDARALAMKGKLLHRAGRRQAAADTYRLAIQAFRRDEDPTGLAGALLGLGLMSTFLGELEEAERCLAEAGPLFEGAGESVGLGRVVMAQGNLALQRVKLDEAAAKYERARGLFEPAGAGIELCRALNGLAEAKRLAGDADEALGAYRAIIAQQEEMGAWADMDFARFNIALTQVGARRFADAEETLAVVAKGLERRPHPILDMARRFCAMPCAAARGDAVEVREHLGWLRENVTEPGWMEFDDAVNAAVAGDIAATHGAEEVAPELWTLAAEIFESAGHEARAEAERAKVRARGV